MIATVVAAINVLLVISRLISSYPLLTLQVAMQPLADSISSAFLMHITHYFCKDYYSVVAITLQKVRRPLKFVLTALLCWVLYNSYVIRIVVVGHLTWRGVQEICCQRSRLKISSRTIRIDAQLSNYPEKDKNFRRIWLTTAIENMQHSIQKLTPTFVRTAFLSGVSSSSKFDSAVTDLEHPLTSRVPFQIGDSNEIALPNSEEVKSVTARTGNIQYINSAQTRANDDMSPAFRQRPPNLLRFKLSDRKDQPSVGNDESSVGEHKQKSSTKEEKTVLNYDRAPAISASQKSVSFVDDHYSSLSATRIESEARTLDPHGISLLLVQGGVPTNQTTRRNANSTPMSNDKNEEAHTDYIEQLETEHDHVRNERYLTTPSQIGRRGKTGSARRGIYDVEILEDTCDTVNHSRGDIIGQDSSSSTSNLIGAKKRQYPFTPEHDDGASDPRSYTVDELDYQEKKRLGHEFRSVLLGARALIVTHDPLRNGNGHRNFHNSSKRERGDNDDDEEEGQKDRRSRAQRTDDSLPYTEKQIVFALPARAGEPRAVAEQTAGRPILKRNRKVIEIEADRDLGNLDEDLKIYQKSQFQMKSSRRKSEVLRGVNMLLGGKPLSVRSIL